MRHTLISAVAALLLSQPVIAAEATGQTAVSVEPASRSAPTPQPANAEDMAVFEPYIGTFRSQDYTRASDGASFHFTIKYSWFDTPKSIVAYKLTMVVPGDEIVREIGEGFYFFDRVNRQIGVIGMFTDGRSGQGTMGVFDRKTHNRTVWVTGTSPDQPTIEVRDGFELIDRDSWRNLTRIRPAGTDADWQTVSDTIYTRVHHD